MKTLAAVLMCASMALVAGHASAQDAVGNGQPMPKVGKKKAMTAQECRDYMAMPKKDGDTSSKKKDAMCAKIIKKDDAMTKK